MRQRFRYVRHRQQYLRQLLAPESQAVCVIKSHVLFPHAYTRPSPHALGPAYYGIGFGPIFRVAYFLVMLWALMRAVLWGLIEAGVPVNRDAVLGGFWGYTTDWTSAHPSWAVCALLGLVLGGVTHSVADAVVSWAKRVW